MKNLLLSLFGFGAAADETTPAWAVGRPERQGHARRKTDRWRPVTRRQMQALYERPDSFTDLLPWTEYDPDTQCFMLDDGRSVGALFEIFPITSEARPDESMQLLHQRLQHIITDAIPEEDPPWVLQIYVQDELSLDGLAADLRAYHQANVADNAFTRHFQDLMNAHLRDICQPGGLFKDELSDVAWKGQRRRVRAALYRRLPPGYTPRYGTQTPIDELRDVAQRFMTTARGAGLGIVRTGGRELYEWLIPWFNPDPVAGGSPRELLRIAPYPDDERGEALRRRPYGRDFAALFSFSYPRSDDAARTWYFDDQPHLAVTIDGLRANPYIGHFTAERTENDRIYAPFDHLPEGAVMAMTLVIKPQDQVANQVQRIKGASGFGETSANMAKADALEAERLMQSGLKLYPAILTFYIKGRDDRELNQREHELITQLANHGLAPITREADLLALDSYIRHLPMAYDPALDRLARRTRLVWSDHLAGLAPFHGRSRGTAHPGLVFFNRGGEPVTADPLHKADRKKNAHMVILGPTGAGKSAMLCYLVMQMLAGHRPRIFLIEAGNSFGLLGQYLQAHGITVNQVTIQPGAGVSLPPFADALKLLGSRFVSVEADEDGEDEEDERRDLLGEMELIATLMITGGEEKERARLMRADRNLIRQAILGAARHARDAGKEQVLTGDVVASFRRMARSGDMEPDRARRAAEMAEALELFTTGFDGEIFNRPGARWPEADVTILDMGVLAREGYGAQLAVAYTSIMQHINDLVERQQHSGRQNIVITDEAHIITTNPLLSGYVVKVTKMWRKLNTWYWAATQNLEDFPDAAKKMLNMMEWWLCLVMPKEEVEQIARFKKLSEEQRALMLSARKEPPKYVEGVLLSDQLTALVRNVPPPIAVALAMTEGHEKAERAKIMREHGCTEVEAAVIVAERLAASRRGKQT